MELYDLLAQWDVQRNLPLTPSGISRGSKRKVWWKCGHGHSWRCAVYTRTGSGTGCPVCAGKVALPGKNDLASRYPQLAAQWHPSKNGPLEPESVLPGSHRYVWWVCGQGHEWRAQIKSRVSGCGCPVCANREILPEQNDLASRYPQLAAQWHPTKNGALRPDQLAPGSRRKVWWICGKGHEWLAAVSSRSTGGSGCPVCAGKRIVPGENDLASRYPEIASQWHPTKNGTLLPSEISPHSSRKLWWVCEHGHEYRASAASRTLNGTGCPYCAGRRVMPGFNDLASQEPGVAAQWHPTLNGSTTPEMVTVGSHRKVWWLCEHGHAWKAAIYSRTGSKKCGCPVCAGHVSRRHLERYRALIPDEAPRPPDCSTNSTDYQDIDRRNQA